MPIMKSICSWAVVAIVGVVMAATHGTHAQIHRTLPKRQFSAVTYQGCYSSAGSLSKNTSYLYNTETWCQTQCAPAGFKVEGVTAGKDCYCGDELPPESDKVDDSKCNTPCAGYGVKNCGGASTFMVYLTGVDDSSVAGTNSGSSSSSSSATSSASSSSTVSASPSVVTVGGQTMTVTAGATSTPTESKSSGGTSKVGIAVGVVVGVIAIAAAAGGGYLFWRQKRRQELLEEHQKAAAVSEYHTPKSTLSPGGSFDTHLEPASLKRLSQESLQDGFDYSRRILKVTNASPTDA